MWPRVKIDRVNWVAAVGESRGTSASRFIQSEKFKLFSMSVADDILDEVSSNPGLTESDLVRLLFGRRSAYQQRVNSTCRRLVQEGRLERLGKGGAADPYTYRIPPIKRRG